MLTFTRTNSAPLAVIETKTPEGIIPVQYIYHADIVPNFSYYGGACPMGTDDLEVDHPIEQISPLFDPDDRITMFIAGCQKCGKSFFIGNFIRNHYLALHPERTIYIVTGLSERDRNFEGLNMLKISTDPKFLASLTLEQLRTNPLTGERNGALVVFDDIDRISDKKSSNAVYKLASDILSNGRDHTTQAGMADIDCIITNHEANDWLKTRTALTECNWVVLFPAATTHRTMTTIIDKIGASKEQKQDIIKYRSSRYLLLHKTFPKFCVMEDRIFLLD